MLAAFEAAGEPELFDEFVLLSTRDLLDRYFESEHLKGFLNFFGMVSIWGGPSTPGTSYVYGHHAWGEFDGTFGQFGFARGGMGGDRRRRSPNRPKRTGSRSGSRRRSRR